MRTALQAAVLLVILVVCTGFTLGLTWAPCYSSLCSEEFFPADTRYHIASYYGLIAATAIALALRAYSPACYRLSSTYLTKHPVPIFNRHFTVGGVTLAIWIVGIILVTTAFWIDPLVEFWSAKTDPVGWSSVRVSLVVTGIIGHHVDLPLGLLFIPVGRNSMLVRVFKIPYGTLLYAHKLIAYLTILGVYAHGIAYMVFWAQYNAKPYGGRERAAFEVNNPTLTVAESQARGAWSRATLGTGLASFIFMVVILITALPVLRRRAYNLFYYTHIAMTLLIIIGASFHASTDFYFLLPGILLWVIDWTWRLFRGDVGLFKQVDVTMSAAGGGWYRLILPPAAIKGLASEQQAKIESQLDRSGTASPLQTFFINIPALSKVQNHPFTAAKVETTGDGAVLLFQRVQSTAIKRSIKAQDREWTWKLANLIDLQTAECKHFTTIAHVEGPYEPLNKEFETADTVICIVGGTGLTGAYSLARWWHAHRRSESRSRFLLIWTVRHKESLELQEWAELTEQCFDAPNMKLSTHCSSVDGRLNIPQTLQGLLESGSRELTASRGAAWVYASGPGSLLTATADTCIAMEAEIREAEKSDARDRFVVSSLTHCTANWEV